MSGGPGIEKGEVEIFRGRIDPVDLSRADYGERMKQKAWILISSGIVGLLLFGVSQLQ